MRLQSDVISYVQDAHGGPVGLAGNQKRKISFVPDERNLCVCKISISVAPGGWLSTFVVDLFKLSLGKP